MKSEKIIIYDEINAESVKYIYDAVVIEQWSVHYASRKVRGGINAIKRNFEKWPILKEMYTIYMDRKKRRVALGYRNCF